MLCRWIDMIILNHFFLIIFWQLADALNIDVSQVEDFVLADERVSTYWNIFNSIPVFICITWVWCNQCLVINTIKETKLFYLKIQNVFVKI